MGAMASQINSPTIVYSIVYSGADQRKHESSASLAFAGHSPWPVNSQHKWPVTRRMFPFDDVIMIQLWIAIWASFQYKHRYRLSWNGDSHQKDTILYLLLPTHGNVAWLCWTGPMVVMNIVKHTRWFIFHDDVIKWKHFPRYWPFVREFTRHRWIPLTKASDAELCCFLWTAPE